MTATYRHRTKLNSRKISAKERSEYSLNGKSRMPISVKMKVLTSGPETTQEKADGD